jgi:hypothetical protein
MFGVLKCLNTCLIVPGETFSSWDFMQQSGSLDLDMSSEPVGVWLVLTERLILCD